MRKASKILGIIGGTLAVIIALFAMLGGAIFTSFEQAEVWSEGMESVIATDDTSDTQVIDDESMVAHFVSRVFFILGAFILIMGVMGVVAGAIVNKHNVASGILMIVASAALFFTVWGFISFVLLLLGGIFALIKEPLKGNLQEDV